MLWDQPSFAPVGDGALLVTLGDALGEELHRQLIRPWHAMQAANIAGLVDVTPAFTTLLVQFDPILTDHRSVRLALEHICLQSVATHNPTGRTVEIPVCYGGAYGADFTFVCEHAGLSPQEVIDLHSGRDYLIYMIGFLPGFPYLGGMDERLFTPRLQIPRTNIPAGSVGIGGEQTGIYPIESPGGWQLIGRTPLALFDPSATDRPLYQAGDRIRFVPISPAEYVRQAHAKGGL